MLARLGYLEALEGGYHGKCIERGCGEQLRELSISSEDMIRNLYLCATVHMTFYWKLYAFLLVVCGVRVVLNIALFSF